MKLFLYVLLLVCLVSSCNENAQDIAPSSQVMATSDYSKIAQANLQNTANQEAYLSQQLSLLNLSKEEVEKASRGTSNGFFKDSYKGLNNLGNLLFSQGSYDLALFYYISSLQILVFNDKLEAQAIAFRNIALTYQEKGDYENAAINFWQSFYLWEEIGDMSRQGQLYNDLGVVYALAHDFVPAENFDVENSTTLHFYESAIDIHTEINDLERVVQAEYNIDLLYTAWLGKESNTITSKGEKDELQYAQDDVEDIL